MTDELRDKIEAAEQESGANAVIYVRKAAVVAIGLNEAYFLAVIENFRRDQCLRGKSVYAPAIYQDLIAEQLGCSLRTVDRIQRSLVAQGLITVHSHRGKDGKNRASTYMLTADGRRVLYGSAAPKSKAVAEAVAEPPKTEEKTKKEKSGLVLMYANMMDLI